MFKTRQKIAGTSEKTGFANQQNSIKKVQRVTHPCYCLMRSLFNSNLQSNCRETRVSWFPFGELVTELQWVVATGPCALPTTVREKVDPERISLQNGVVSSFVLYVYCEENIDGTAENRIVLRWFNSITGSSQVTEIRNSDISIQRRRKISFERWVWVLSLASWES